MSAPCRPTPSNLTAHVLGRGAATPGKTDTTVIAALYVAGAPPDHDTLARHCAAGPARTTCPRRFTRIDILPQGANGKILRRALRQSFEAPDAIRDDTRET